jgi:hypothetical protein
MRTAELKQQTLLITQNFTANDFNELAENYLTKLALDKELKKELLTRLNNFSEPFANILKPYFEIQKKNKRFDEVMENIGKFIGRLKISILNKKGDNIIFINFWNNIATLLYQESKQMEDKYLINSLYCFKYEIEQLS